MFGICNIFVFLALLANVSPLAGATGTSCPCGDGKTLIETFLDAYYQHNQTAAESLPLCKFVRTFRTVYKYSVGPVTYQPGGDDLTTLNAILNGTQDDFTIGAANVTVQNGDNCTVFADFVDPSNSTENSSRVRQVLYLTPVPTNVSSSAGTTPVRDTYPPGDGTTQCYISTIASYVCVQLGQATCPKELGGPVNEPLPPPASCQGSGAILPCFPQDS